MNVEPLADRVMNRLAGRANGEVSVVKTTNSLTRFANSFIHQNVSDVVTSVELTLESEGRFAHSSTQRTTEEALDTLISNTLEAAAASPLSEKFPGFAPQAAVPSLDHHDPSTATATPTDRAEVVKAFVDAGDGLEAAGFCETIEFLTAYANTEGQRATGELTRAVVDGIHRTTSSAGKGHQTSLRFSDLDGAAAGARAVAKARAAQDPFDLDPGRYEVILEPNAVGTIAVFLGVYGFNGLAVAEGRSFATIGDAMFDTSISLRNDPTHPEAIGFPYDVEGTPTRPTELVERGTVVGHVHDRTTAKAMGLSSTGNAAPRAQRTLGVVPVNLFIDPGDMTRDDMIASVERGLLVTEFNYCRVLDPLTVGMTGLTRNGTFLIENGSVAGAVTNLRFTQSVVAALEPGNVLGVESDSRLSDSEFGVGFTHVPSLHLGEWNFTGGAGG